MLLPTETKTILTVAMVIATCLIVIHCAKVQEEEEDDGEVVGIREIGVTDYQQSYNENQKLLVFLYRPDCDKCPETLEILTKFTEHPELPSGLRIVKSFNHDLLTKLRTEKVPSLVYLREKSHVIYDGNYDAKDMLEWIRLATNKIMQRLDDESFPRFVKTDTADTTDDWLVVFYKETCKSVLPVVETFGVRVHGQVKVAKVNILESPKLTYRFEVTNCPEVVFFKQGTMYKYKPEIVDSASLKDFVGGSYKTGESQAVPDAQTESDFFAQNIKDMIKTYSGKDYKPFHVAGLCLLVAGLLLLCIACRCRAGKKRPRRKQKAQ